MSNRFIDWMQIITGLAVIAGLGLVVYELRQSHDLARADAVSQTRSMLTAQYAQILGENFSDTLAKACFEPDALTPSELLQMDAYVRLQLNAASQLRQHSEIAFDYDWRSAVTGPLERVLATPVGRAHYDYIFSNFAAGNEWLEYVEELEASGELRDCRDYFETILGSTDP